MCYCSNTNFLAADMPYRTKSFKGIKVPEIRDCQNCESLYSLTIDNKIVFNYLKATQNMMACRPNLVPTEIRPMEPLGSSVKIFIRFAELLTREY